MDPVEESAEEMALRLEWAEQEQRAAEERRAAREAALAEARARGEGASPRAAHPTPHAPRPRAAHAAAPHASFRSSSLVARRPFTPLCAARTRPTPARGAQRC